MAAAGDGAVGRAGKGFMPDGGALKNHNGKRGETMVQVGNFHLGKAQTAQLPTLSIDEAATMWDMLSARYKCIEETEIYYNYAHDPEFKTMIARMGLALLKRQAEELERQCRTYGLPMPGRPAESVNRNEDGENFRDEYMFRQIFEGCQHQLEALARSIKSTVHSDPLREMYTGFFNEELTIFNQLCKYGKMKGWLEAQPAYKTH
jgi:hypothetical protein